MKTSLRGGLACSQLLDSERGIEILQDAYQSLLLILACRLHFTVAVVMRCKRASEETPSITASSLTVTGLWDLHTLTCVSFVLHLPYKLPGNVQSQTKNVKLQVF